MEICDLTLHHEDERVTAVQPPCRLSDAETESTAAAMRERAEADGARNGRRASDFNGMNSPGAARRRSVRWSEAQETSHDIATSQGDTQAITMKVWTTQELNKPKPRRALLLFLCFSSSPTPAPQ